MEKCVITGLGLVCALGSSAGECFDKAVEGVIGIADVTSVDTEKCYAHKGGEAPFFKTPEGEDRASSLAIKAAGEAVADAKLDIGKDADRVSVVVGSCVGGAVSIEKYYRDYLDDPAKAKKEDVLKMPISAIANNVAEKYGAKGVIDNIANACAAGTMSIARACELIRSGKADVVIAGGSDPMSSLAFSGFIALHAIDENGCAPFNRSTGISLGEGSGMVVVESYEHAKKRNAKIYCEVLGSGASSDAHHITAPAPDGEGQMTAMQRALDHSGIKNTDVDYINAHGTGTPLNDSSETKSMLTLFGGSKDVCASSSKSMFGHCLGAAGSVEAVMCIKAIEKGIAPPTANFENQDQIDAANERTGGFDVIPNKGKKKQLDYVMSNNYAFGGNNASIIYAKEGAARDMKDTAAEKIYITGIGVVSPLGNTASAFAESVNACSKPRMSENHADSFESNADTADYDAVGLKLSFYRKLDKMSRQTCVSGKYALMDANIEITPENCKSVGIVAGTSDGPQSEIGNFQQNIIKNGNQAGSAFVFPNTVYNACSGYLSICTGIKGYTVTVSNGFSSGLAAVANAADVAKTCDEDIILAVGTDENSETVYGLYEKLGAVGKRKFNLSEGATTLVLEKASAAKRRGAKVYAQLSGSGYAHDPVPFGKFGSPETLIKAVDNALANAGLKASDITAVYGLADGLEALDAADKKLKEYLPAAKYENIVSLAGEGRAATSALSVAAAAMAVSGDIKKAYKTDAALIVSGSAGGSYVAVIIKKA